MKERATKNKYNVWIQRTFFVILLLVLYETYGEPAGFEAETGKIHNTRWTSGVSLGGIGCGKIELLTDGAFGNFTINNNWDRRTGMVKGTFFAIRTDNGRTRAARILRLPLEKAVPEAEVEKKHRRLLGLPADTEYINIQHIQHTEYFGAFPFARMKFLDENLPVEVELLAWSPLIPHNLKDSSLPVALFRFALINTTEEPVEVTLLFSWQNILGWGGDGSVHWESYEGDVQFIKNTSSLTGLQFITEQRYSSQRQNVVGEYYLGTPGQVDGEVEYCEMWDAGGNEISWWREFVNSGRIPRKVEQSRGEEFKPAAAITVRNRLTPYEKKEVYFVVSWFVPSCITQYVKRTPLNVTKESDADTTKALDGDLNTYWSTKRRMLAGDAFMVDLGAIRTINKITLNNHGAPNEYPRGCELLGSADGEHWFTIKKFSAKEAGRLHRDDILSIDFSPVSTRYLKINQLTTLPDYAWRISELKVFNKKKRKIEEINPVSATAYVVQESEDIVMEDISHYYTNYFETAVDVAEYAFKYKDDLLRKTEEWQNLVWKSNLPFWLKLKLINTAFVMFSNTVFTGDGRFSVLESPVSMAGALGTSDQRMSAHAFCAMFFPELDRKELELFAKCQMLIEPVADGRIPHFTGNVHEIVGNPNVRGGVRDWPDLSCSWVMQVLKFYHWTGDTEFLKRLWIHIQRAMDWLEEADNDGDGIPEGGSTFDYEHPKRGAFCYTASCYLGALKAATAIATALGDEKQAIRYQRRFNLAQKNMLKHLWNGKYFIKLYNPLTGEKNPNCFVAQLAGDWLAQLSGIGEILPREKKKSAIKELIERNVKPFYPIPPMEVTPEGKIAVNACYIIQQETYLGMEAIYAGYVNEGLEVIKRVYDTVWLKNYDPWSQALWYDVPTAGRQGLVYYMTSPATWHVLNALAGITVNLPAETLYVNPQLPTNIDEWHIPVFFPGFWLWLDYIPREKKMQLRVLKTFSDREWFISKIVLGEDNLPVKLPEKLKIKEKTTLDLSPYLDKFFRLER